MEGDESKIVSENDFDRLPNDVVRLILNRVHDAKSLCACLAVSTRFNSLTLQSTNLSLTVDRIHDSDDDDSDRSDSKHSLLRSLFKLFISKPLRFLNRLVSSRTDSTAVFYSPTQALKSFSNIEVLKIQLPSHRELQLDGGASNPVLTWKANFGSQLKTCVIVTATSIDQLVSSTNSDEDVYNKERGCTRFEAEKYGNNKLEEQNHQARGPERAEEAPAPPPPPPRFAISNEDLKMRVVWTISCLIAASSRHQLLKRIVSSHPMLKSIKIVDEHHQGTLTMEEPDISQMRTTFKNSDLSSTSEAECERSRIPALKMKMWHVAELELPRCKKVMKGATLLVIGAADGIGFGEEEVFEEGEEMMYGEAAREIRRKMKRSYSLEMESF